VAGLTDHGSLEHITKLPEESTGNVGIENEAGRKLDQYGSEPVFKMADRVDKTGKRSGGIEESFVVGDGSGQLN
jgi:hypothetical protein